MKQARRKIATRSSGLCVVVAATLFVSALIHAQDSSNSAETAQVRHIQMVAAHASLNKGLDAKKAKQGDPVTATLLDDVKIPDAANLPKNTVLLGHIDQVQPSANKSDSTIQMTFDKAQLKNGQQLPIKATIMQISPPANAYAGGASLVPGQPTPMSSGRTSGPPTSSRAPEAQGEGNPDQSVNGVELKSDVHDSTSGTFMSKGTNVRLPNGMDMQVAVTMIPPN